ELGEAVVPHRVEETSRQLLEQRQVDRLHVRARPAELGWMLTPPPRHHARDRPAVAVERAIGELLLPVAGNELLHHHLAGTDDRRCTVEERTELGDRVRAPCLRLRRVDEVLLDRRLDGEGRLTVDLGELARIPRVPGTGHRDREPRAELVRLALVPGGADRLPGRGRDAEDLPKLVAMAGDRGNRLVSRGIEHPSLQAESASRREQPVDRRPLVTELVLVNGVRRVPGEARDRQLVVDHADGDAAAPEAPDDSEALVVAADDDGAGTTSRCGSSWREAATHTTSRTRSA